MISEGLPMLGRLDKLPTLKLCSDIADDVLDFKIILLCCKGR